MTLEVSVWKLIKVQREAEVVLQEGWNRSLEMTIIIMMTGKEEMIITGRGGEVEAQGEAEVEVLGYTEE